MRLPFLQPRRLVLALAAASAAIAAGSVGAIAPSDNGVATVPNPGDGPTGIVASAQPVRYIVRFAEMPLALLNSENLARGVAPLPLKTGALGGQRLDVHSDAAVSYVAYLKDQQQQHVDAIASALGHGVRPILSMQHALNASLLELTPAEAATVSRLPGVEHVERERTYALATDIGPGFIGAPDLWWNRPAGQDTLFTGGFEDGDGGGWLGDGIVVGDIDTGYNSLSPSFQPTDSKGYSVSNPLGHGNYLGQCNLPLISAAGCNDKVIGVYDEINLTKSEGAFRAYSVEDTQGHGSHTASTAAGNYRAAKLNGYTHDIAGVAPHANLVIYYACSPRANVACSSVATTSAVDHAIADGVVDVLNYSISGGRNPWDDATSLAFLAAESAGIFVAAAAGNTGASTPQPVPYSANHVEPWVATIAAGTHSGGPLTTSLAIDGPAAPVTTELPILSGSHYAGFDAPVRAVPVKLSPAFHVTDTSGKDGCSATLNAGTGYAASTFAGAIAVISRGTCFFGDKVLSAQKAGAVAVIVSDNRVEDLTQASFTLDDVADGFTPEITVPVTFVSQADGQALQAYLNAHAVTAATLPVPFARLKTTPDELANFSLLGPAYLDVVKPDLQAPGVNILAAVANDGSPGGPNRVAMLSGTSMATPHTAGAGALLRQVHPSWSPAQVKSALMLSAKETGLTKPDGVTPSNFFDRGAGRIQVDAAANVGIVLDENALDFALANPDVGGDPHSLNLASLQDADCAKNCSFTRTFTSSATKPVKWSVGFAVDAGTASPSNFTLQPGASQTVKMDINSAGLAPGHLYATEFLLLPDDPALAPLHMPLAIGVPSPNLVASPSPLNIAGVGSASASAALSLFNSGGGSLDVAQGSSGSANFDWVQQTTRYVWGESSTQYAAREIGAAEYFAAEDFSVTGSAPTTLSFIYTPGFAYPRKLTSFGSNLPLHWRIYADNGGRPSGNPEDGSTPLWSFDTTAANKGVVIGTTGSPNDLRLNLAAAGAPPATLAPGHYWLAVYPTFPCLGAGSGCTTGSWYWATSPSGGGSPAQTLEFSPSATPSWTEIDPSAGKGLAMELGSTVSCAVPAWLSQSGLPLTLGEKGIASVTVTATAPLGAAAATGYLCLATPGGVTAVQVNARQ